jgi:6-phosphogluconolactonase
MKSSILLLLITGAFISLHAQKPDQVKTAAFIVGTYTSSGKDEGIYVYDFNNETGSCSLKSAVSGEENPSFLTISSDGKYVYAVNEIKKGSISSFAFDRNKGTLRFLNRVTSGGDSPCFVEFDDEDRFVFAGNYGSGTLAAIPENPDGTLDTTIQVIKHQGSSIDKSRQKGPHVHSTFLAPDKQFLLVPDLGTDKVNIYSIKKGAKTDPLVPADPPLVSVKPGSGPRHLAFSPNGRFAYLVHEMEGMISCYKYSSGTLTEIQSITMTAPGFTGKSGAADIHISPDGRFLYGSNRGDANDLAIYSIKKNGMLDHIGNQSVYGKSPRNFAIDPTGNYLLVANQDSNEIIIFRRDQKTGALTRLDEKINVRKPVCIKFVP